MDPTVIALSVMILLFSVILHEVTHGWMALKFGDRTAERAGRLTLNPIPHIDPVGTILVPGMFILLGSGFIIGWAKPVPVNPLNFSNLRRGELFVSLAGVGANFALAAVATILYHLSSLLIPNIPFTALAILSFAVTINLILGIFNSLPIPPLDGSKILLSQLPYYLAKEFQKLERFGLLILLLFWFAFPILPAILGIIISTLGSILKVPLRLF